MLLSIEMLVLFKFQISRDNITVLSPGEVSKMSIDFDLNHINHGV